MKALALGLLIAMAGMGQKRPPEYEVRAERAKSNQAIVAKDIKTFGETLADDFTATRGNGGAVASRQAYIESFTAMFQDPKAVRYERVTEKVEMSSAAPLAAEQGRWMATLPGGRKAYGGTYLAMWRKGAAGWKLRSELFVVLRCDDAAACKDYTK